MTLAEEKVEGQGEGAGLSPPSSSEGNAAKVDAGEGRAGKHACGPSCPWATGVLVVLGLVLLLFGFFYLLAPGPSVGSINGIATTLGLHLTPTPSEVPAFRGWVGFTFAYMMGATLCCFMAARTTAPARTAYLNVLLLLKGTSSLTGIGLFLAQAAYPFYLATFLTDGLIFLGVLLLRRHLLASHGAAS